MAMMTTATTALPLQNIAERSDVFNEEVMPRPKEEGKAKTRAKLCNMVQCSSRSLSWSWARTEGDVCVCESAILLL